MMSFVLLKQKKVELLCLKKIDAKRKSALWHAMLDQVFIKASFKLKTTFLL